MTTMQSYERKYGDTNAAVVLSSKAKVAAAGRWGDQARVKAERIRHYQLMANLRLRRAADTEGRPVLHSGELF
jgi:hypothetical protein